MGVFAELQRRKVFRAGAAWLVAGWLLIQVAATVAPQLNLPDWTPRLVTFLVLLGFPITLVLAWVLDVTPDGIRVDRSKTGTKRMVAFAAALAIGVVGWYFLARPAWRQPAPAAPADAPPVRATTAPATASIAVLPFVNMTGDTEDGYFADGIAEEILNSLARVDRLQVVGRTSSFQFKGRNEDLRTIGAKLGVANVLEGSVRRAGTQARITAQLVRTSDGIHLWSQTYDRRLDDVLAVQLDIAEHVAAALDVLLDDRQRSAMRANGVSNVDAFVAYQKGLALYEAAHDSTRSPQLIPVLERANAEFARATALEPAFAMAHFMASDLHEHRMFATAMSDTDRRQGWERVLAELDAAASAGDVAPDQRRFIEADRQILSADWRGLRPRIESALATRSCVETVWLPQLSEPFGYGAQVQAMAERFLACDPLNGSWHTRRAEGANWQGHPTEALAFVAETEAVLGHLSITLRLQRAQALVALGRLDEARAAIDAMDATDQYTELARLQLARARGARGEALRAALVPVDRRNARLGNWEISEMIAATMMGDRAEADRIAHVLDARPAGPTLLAIVTSFCLCGAPFALEATPNFAARVAEAGLPWPPPSRTNAD